ncbi:MAG: hypothetical protein LBG59_01660 [Candidatus Peribacteria bacterium]|jgi:hypothetical protein|nr:hypothetical protein [Candidatus Peribacteria bacterium]
MVIEYQEKSQDTIAADIKNEWDRIGKWGVKDSLEITQATQTVLSKYKKEVEATGISNGWVLAAFTDLESDLTKLSKELEKKSLYANNQVQITELASKIDNAEQMVLERLEGTRREIAEEKNKKEKTEKNQKFYTQDARGYHLTSATNQPTIHKVL